MNSSKEPTPFPVNKIVSGSRSLKQRASGPLLKLYVARSTPNSVRAQRNLDAFLATLQGEARGLVPDVIDVFANGKRAIADGVLVTPTLLIVMGERRHTIVGDLSDVSELASLLKTNSFWVDDKESGNPSS